MPNILSFSSQEVIDLTTSSIFSFFSYSFRFSMCQRSSLVCSLWSVATKLQRQHEEYFIVRSFVVSITDFFKSLVKFFIFWPSTRTKSEYFSSFFLRRAYSKYFIYSLSSLMIFYNVDLLFFCTQESKLIQMTVDLRHSNISLRASTILYPLVSSKEGTSFILAKASSKIWQTEKMSLLQITPSWFWSQNRKETVAHTLELQFTKTSVMTLYSSILSQSQSLLLISKKLRIKLASRGQVCLLLLRQSMKLSLTKQVLPIESLDFYIDRELLFACRLDMFQSIGFTCIVALIFIGWQKISQVCQMISQRQVSNLFGLLRS